MIKVGIIGLGFMAATHVKAYRQVAGIEVTALCNPSGRHLDGDFSDVSGNLGLKEPLKLDMTRVRAFRDVADFLAHSGVELVDICAPTLAHPDLAIAALAAGKHVLCEKPLARTGALARQIAEAAAGAKGFFMPAMCLRFFPDWVWVKQAIAEGRYGRVLSARFRRVAEPPGWGKNHFHDGAKSGGALLDLHIHDADFVQFCFGRPRAVLATGYTKFSGAIDHVIAQYDVACGALVHAEGSWAMTPGFGFNMAYTVNFERATVDYDLARGADALKICEEGQAARVLKLEQPDGYVGEIQHLLAAINSGKAPTIVTAADAASAVEICEAEERSIRSGMKVVL